MNPLLDNDFLIKLNNDRNRTIYAHVISLNQYEHPIEALEGVVTAGSITIDGESAVRRTCSLTLSAKNLNINNVYWGITTKVKIEIGLQNNIVGYEKYGDIIWFKQGVFILTDFKTTQTINNYTINLTGKDKMCLLNGDVSGNLPASVVFDSYDESSGDEGGCVVDETGNYSSFVDENLRNTILAGLNQQYHTDYQYIRAVGNIIALDYIPAGSINTDAEISFSPNGEEAVKLTSLLSNLTDEKISINLADRDISGFVVRGCNPGDKFIWEIRTKIPITLILQEMLHQFGQELYSNIIIRDIDAFALEMLDNTTENNYYLLHDGVCYTNFVNQDDLIENYQIYLASPDEADILIDETTQQISNIVFRNYIEEDDISLIDIVYGSTLSEKKTEFTTLVNKADPLGAKYTVTPVRQDEVAGYGMTLLVYPDDLKASPGDSITSILDKIVNMLGGYEYFYDLNGQFIFQAKPAYLRTAWNKTIYLNKDNYIDPSELSKQIAYTFDNAVLTTQYQNTPNMNNIKNDYVIWGERKGVSGNPIKFHGRYAIDNIPLEYTDFNGYTWTANKKGILWSILQAKLNEKGEYEREYDYPEGMDSHWWEINDWAKYYSSVFGIDLSVNATQMHEYSKLRGYGIIKYDDLKDILPAGANLKNVGELFHLNWGNEFSDIITVIYSDSSKTTPVGMYTHGSACTHRYCEFMDLRKLNKGWSYTATNSKDTTIINVVDSRKKYTLENGTTITHAYNPDITTSFIYDPILPHDAEDDLISYLTTLIYPDVKNENGNTRKYALLEDVDWRHLIHIMADDWYAHNHEDDFELNIRKNNSWPDLNLDLFPYGRTNYEQYYLDFTSIGGFWQDIYNIDYVYYQYLCLHEELQEKETEMYEKLKEKFDAETCKDETHPAATITLRSYSKAKSGSHWNITCTVADANKNAVNEELTTLKNYVISSNWTSYVDEDDETYHILTCSISEKLIKDITPKYSLFAQIINSSRISSEVSQSFSVDLGRLKGELEVNANLENFFTGGEYKYWHKDVIYNPENLIFWFEFFEADSMGIGKFATSVIGDRPKTINDSNIKVISYRDTPDVIYCTQDEYDYYDRMCSLKDGYIYIIVDNDIKNNMSRSIRYKTVHSQADDMLYQYSHYNDTVNINAVPIYYLQPNTIISIKDELSKIVGYYVMNKINISLAYNGMMQITAIKSPEKIY